MPRVVKNVDCLICKGPRDSSRAVCSKCDNVRRAAAGMKWCHGIREFSFELLADGYSHELVRHMLRQAREKQFKGRSMAKVLEAGERRCSRCGVTKPLDEMSAGGKISWCKDCSNERHREKYREKHGPVVYKIKIPENFCRHCSQWKEVSDFDLTGGKWGTRKDGSKVRKTKCRECDRDDRRARDRKHQEKMKALRKPKVTGGKWSVAANRRVVSRAELAERATEEASRAAWWCSLSDKEKSQIRYRENRDVLLERNREYRRSEKGRARRLEKKREYRKTEKGKAAMRRYEINRRAREKNAKGRLTKDSVKMRFEYYGNKCKYCGDTENLQVEHQIPLSRGGTNWPSNIAPACAKCNCDKGTMTNAEYLLKIGKCGASAIS